MSDDQALLLRYARTRDAVAFNQIVQLYSSLVFSVARRVTGNIATAEDITQDCFLTLASRASSIRGSLPAWLHRVALNLSMNVTRNEAVRKRHEAKAYVTPVAVGESTWDQITPLVDKALSELPKDLQEPVIQHFFLGRTQSQIAVNLRVSQATVSRRLQEGINKLREHLSKAGVICGSIVLSTTLIKNASAAVPAQLSASLAKMALTGPAMSVSTSALKVKTAGTSFSGPVSHLTNMILMHKSLTFSVLSIMTFAVVSISLIVVQAGQVAAPQADPYKYGLYIHFDISTFAGYKGDKDKDIGRVPIERYAPTGGLDVRGWARTAKQAGMDFAVLTAKHEAGFCLWDCADYDYDVAGSPVKTDVLAEFISACKAEGISPGIHYSIPDAHSEGSVMFKGPVAAPYFELIKKQIKELHTKYPDIKIQVFDGANRLSQDQLRELCQVVKECNPSCTILNGILGNDAESKYVCDSVNKGWFWSPNAQLVPTQKLYEEYSKTRANGWPFLLNVGPDKSGRIPDQYSTVLTELKGMIDHNSTK